MILYNHLITLFLLRLALSDDLTHLRLSAVVLDSGGKVAFEGLEFASPFAKCPAV